MLGTKFSVLLLVAIFATACEPLGNDLRQQRIVCSSLTLVLVPEGKCWLGSYSSEAFPRETPMCEYTVDYELYMSTTEIPISVYVVVLPEAGGKLEGVSPEDSLLPAIVDREEAKKFCAEFQRLLQRDTGREWVVRLPFEAEWEYAARYGRPFHEDWWPRVGGTETDSYDLKAHAWFDENSGERMHAIGEKQPNALGLYDMFGNAGEWCEGTLTYTVTQMVRYCAAGMTEPVWGSSFGKAFPVRGGNYMSSSGKCRPSSRQSGATAGFRIVALPKTK